MPNCKNIVRLIPNATSIVNEGYNPVCFSEDMSEWKKESLLRSFVGWAVRSKYRSINSKAMPYVATLPTYFWFQWKELIEIGSQISTN